MGEGERWEAIMRRMDASWTYGSRGGGEGGTEEDVAKGIIFPVFLDAGMRMREHDSLRMRLQILLGW